MLAGCGAGATSPVVDSHATPRGWVAVPFGQIQISVPASWFVLRDGAGACGLPSGSGGVLLINGGTWCGPNDRTYAPPPTPPTVTMNVTRPGDEIPHGKAERVHGISVQPVVDGSWWLRAFNLSITIRGTDPSAILKTLTYSPRAAVLSGSASAPPSDWHSVTFAGLRFAAPPSWKVHTTSVALCGPDPESQLGYHGVLLVPRIIASPSCPGALPYATPENDGIEVDAWDHSRVRSRQCLSSPRTINGLAVCILSTPADDSLDMVVTEANGPLIHIELGLAGTGSEDKTVLYSLRPA